MRDRAAAACRQAFLATRSDSLAPTAAANLTRRSWLGENRALSILLTVASVTSASSASRAWVSPASPRRRRSSDPSERVAARDGAGRLTARRTTSLHSRHRRRCSGGSRVLTTPPGVGGPGSARRRASAEASPRSSALAMPMTNTELSASAESSLAQTVSSSRWRRDPGWRRLRHPARQGRVKATSRTRSVRR